MHFIDGFDYVTRAPTRAPKLSQQQKGNSHENIPMVAVGSAHRGIDLAGRRHSLHAQWVTMNDIEDIGARKRVGPVYLGDGLYVHFDGYQLWLHANSHDRPTDRVALEPAVFHAFLAYARKIGWTI